MPRLILLSCLASTGCAANIWDSRVFSCDKIDSVVLRGGSVVIEQELDDEGDPVECYVAVQGLRGLDVDGDTLSGTDFTVFATEDFLQLDLENSQLVINQPERQINAPFASDYEWSPSRQALTADVPADEVLTIMGSIHEVHLRGEGATIVAQADGLTKVDGTTGDLAVEALTNLEEVNVEAEGEVFLIVPLEATYRLESSVSGVTLIDARIQLLDDTATTDLTITASQLTITIDSDGTIPEPASTYTVTCKSGYGLPSPPIVVLSVDTSLSATKARVDIVDSIAGPQDARYESHAMYPGPNGKPPFKVWLETDRSYQDGFRTSFSCQGDKELAEDPGGQTMTYLVRVYDRADVVDCYAVGHDPLGMIQGSYFEGLDIHKPDQISPEACVALLSPTAPGTMR